jgi:hypothetical protein
VFCVVLYVCLNVCTCYCKCEYLLVFGYLCVCVLCGSVCVFERLHVCTCYCKCEYLLMFGYLRVCVVYVPERGCVCAYAKSIRGYDWSIFVGMAKVVDVRGFLSAK